MEENKSNKDIGENNDKKDNDKKDNDKEDNDKKDNDKEDNDKEDKSKITEEFVEMVKCWVKLDDKIRDLQNKIKLLKNDKKEYESFILEYMDKIDEKVIEISDGKLRQNKSNTKTGLKEQNIQTALFELTKDSNKAFEMTKYIMDKRPSVERVNLKRTKFRSKNV